MAASTPMAVQRATARRRRLAQSTSQAPDNAVRTDRPIQLIAQERRDPSAPACEKMKTVDGKYARPTAAKPISSARSRPAASRPPGRHRSSRPPAAKTNATTVTPNAATCSHQGESDEPKSWRPEDEPDNICDS